MTFFLVVGIITSAFMGLGLTFFSCWILGNIYGGIRGAYRFDSIRVRDGHPKMMDHKTKIKMGFKNWLGEGRYDADERIGSYWAYGSMRIPLDGRDKISRQYLG